MAMMNAREMFEELGYKRNVESEKIIYLIETKGSFYYQEIIFNLVKKVIVIDGNFLEVAIETNLLKAINEQANELGWLEEEQKEIKQETNLEHYYDDLLRVGSHFTFMYGKIRHCWNLDCRKCPFDKGECDERRFKWLLSPYEKTYKEKENE